MLRHTLVILALANCALLAAGESESDDGSIVKVNPSIVLQEKGLAKGSFNPWKHAVNLPPNAKIMVIPVNDHESTYLGMMDDWQVQFIRRRLKLAEREKFDLVVLEIDSNGGSVPATEAMLKDIENCKVPVIAYIKNKALSCGLLLSLGCKMIVMEPNSEIGSLKVIDGWGGDYNTTMRMKVDGAMCAKVRDLCALNGHPSAVVQGMVDSNCEVYETTDPERRFMTDSEYEIASKHGVTIKRKLKLKNQILALNAKEAVDTGLASGIAADMDELALGMGASNAQVVRVDITGAECVARFLANPLWSVLLVIVGLVGLFWEMHSPGHGIGYAVFAFSLGMFFFLQIYSHNAGIIGLVLFALGSLLVAVELFILPTFGSLGFVGMAMVIGSVVLAFLPEGTLPGLIGISARPNEYVMKQIIEGMEWATLTLLSIIGVFALAWWKGITLPGVNRLALNTVNSGNARGGGTSSGSFHAVDGGGPRAASKLAALVGLVGKAETMLRPAGKIRLEGATYDAVSEGGFIEPGAIVHVLRAQGSALVVRMTEKEPPATIVA